MKREWKHWIGAVLVLVLALPAAAQYSSSRKKPAAAKAATTETAANTGAASPAGSPTTEAPRAATIDPSYVIGAQDVINISVWKEPELSLQIPVRPDGKISLPLIRDIEAAGLTPLQLAADITARLKQYVADPQVTVIVAEIRSRRFYVLGEVPRPGAFPLLPHMTVLQAISTAGGFNQFANVSKIYVLRAEDGKQLKFPFNYKKVIAGRNAEQNIELKSGDTIVVP
jgi:polysaccharide export outer membrane protein